MSTGIEWTDETWNPIAGCSDVSEGCRHCYARGMAKRLSAMGMAKYQGLTVLQGSGRGVMRTVWTGKIAFDEAMLRRPLGWKRPRRIFVNSMSDLFHPGVTDEQIDRIFAVMALCPQHTFQVLTKRPERMLAYSEPSNRRVKLRLVEMEEAGIINRALEEAAQARVSAWPLPNLWLGVSVEDQKAADARIPLLLQTPAAVRFLSCEPLLGPVDLTHYLHLDETNGGADFRGVNGWGYDEWSGGFTGPTTSNDSCYAPEPGLHWVIVGGESGPGARPMHPGWARILRDQCAAAGVPYFFKQHGEYRCSAIEPDASFSGSFAMSNPVAGGRSAAVIQFPSQKAFKSGETLRLRAGDATMQGVCLDDQTFAWRVGKKAAGDLLDGVQHHAFPEVRG
jgi:protein gp37